MKHARITVTLFASAALATGCTGTPSDGATATPSLSPGPSLPATSSTVPDVPRVEPPLNVDSFLAQPCTSLTDDQVTEYLGENTEQEDKTERSSGPSCSWYSGLRSNAHISVTYPRLTDEGLTAIYRNRDKTAYFTELSPVDGYPAIATGTTDNRDEGECLVIVGTSASDYMNIDMYLGDGSVGKVDPCEAAHEVATTVIGNIRATN
ncbi:DUF3558 domain-containing protein [Saccharomonospora cyanea]|uniref:DUF3558 domain-containing protein n=1 Tax=Saccharomonospora cyanea NA-134 TaxID=882082 RepID=H5XEV8_9PSEU|nr:DUF3558 domain-containing protein [Saccharomonospora cyanea]EHR59340.1 Protein of unknown function (DUF3558) [Saccharomonospora cyanea NA-134]